MQIKRQIEAEIIVLERLVARLEKLGPEVWAEENADLIHVVETLRDEVLELISYLENYL